jgi:hypothetical protein
MKLFPLLLICLVGIVSSKAQTVGIGTLVPNAKLHVNSASDLNPFRVQVNGSSKLFVNFDGGVSIGTSVGGPANGLYVFGNIGIGINNPNTKLHVVGGSDASPTGGGYIVTGNVTAANIAIDDNEIMARDFGSTTTLFLNNAGGDLIFNGTNGAGRMGIGVTSPQTSIHVRQKDANRAITMQHHNTADSWTVGVGGTTLSYRFEFNEVVKAQIEMSDGVYVVWSDRRLKEDIAATAPMLNKVMQLKPCNYFLKNNRGHLKNKSLGFIAQEVEMLFPELVYASDEGYKGLNYSGFGVVAIKAIQEQQEKIQSLEERIAKLETLIAEKLNK